MAYYMSDDLTLYPVIPAGNDYKQSLNYSDKNNNNNNNNNNNPSPDTDPGKNEKLLRRSRIDQARLAQMTKAQIKKLKDNRIAARESAYRRRMRPRLIERAVKVLEKDQKMFKEISEYLKDHLKRRYTYDIWPAFGCNSPYNTPQEFSCFLDSQETEIRNAPEPQPNEAHRFELLKKLEALQTKPAETPPDDLKSGTKASRKSRNKTIVLDAQNELLEWELCLKTSRERCVGAKFCEFAIVLNGHLRVLNKSLLPEKVAYDHPMKPIRYPPRA